MAGTERVLQVTSLAGKGIELRIEVDRDGMAKLTRLSAGALGSGARRGACRSSTCS